MRPRHDPVARPHSFPDLLTPDEMARADAASPGLGVPGYTLMENAGRAVARAIQTRFRPCRTLVLCGPGNNGGDGYIVARLLAQEGWPVAVATLAPPREGTDAARARCRWHGPAAPFTAAETARADLVVDAVFGAGLSRDLDPNLVEVLRASSKVVAIDVPSGLDGATGTVRGFAPKAALTVTFLDRKSVV
jgi:ADP-dependent NAD(P)H-hydrate dehydratase / NAD(P)H-hydrate epimerase